MKKQIAIEDLIVWTYERQCAHAVVSTAIMPSKGGDSIAMVERLGALGTAIDGSSGFSVIHPDAETIHLEVLKLGFPQTGILIRFGKTSIIPDWMPGAVPIIRPKLRKNGKIKYIRDKHGNALSPEVEVILSQHSIDTARAAYTEFRDALCAIHAVIESQGLRDHLAMPTLFKPSPWLMHSA